MGAPRRFKGALIGFGQVAEKTHAPAFIGHQNLEIVAVADETAARLRAARSVFSAARTYSSLKDLLREEKGLDFIDIATPPFLHGRQVLAALDSGCHVLCEKPLTLDLAELEAIRHRAAANGRAVFTVHNWAYSPHWLKTMELASSGVLGEIRHVELHALRTRPAAGSLPGDWRTQAQLAGGGILVDHGWHNLYLLRRLIPAAPSRVSARLGSRDERGVEDEATVFFEYPEAAALIHMTWRAPLRRNTAVVHGSRASLELRDDHILLDSGESSPQRFDFPEKLSAGSAHAQWFAALLADFSAAMQNPSQEHRNAEEAAFCLRTIHRVYQSPQP